MAILKKGSNDLILKEISGNLGNIVIRHINGKIVICARQKNRKPSQSIKSINQRNKFKAATKYAKFLKRIPALSFIWDAANVEGQNSFTKIIKQNYKLINIDLPGILNTITPPHFQFRIMDIILFDDNIEIIMEDFFQPDENDKLIMIMALVDPIEPGIDQFQLIDISPAGAMEFTINLTDDQLIQCAKYKSFVLYTAMYRQKGNEIQWSNTVAVKGEMN